MALGLGFGAGIGLWTEADEDPPKPSSASVDSPPASNSTRPSVLGALRAQRPPAQSTGTPPTESVPRPGTAPTTAEVSTPQSSSAAAEIAVAPPMPAWLRNAVSIADSGSRPVIAVVIDDAGLNREGTARINSLSAPLTVSFLSYAGDLKRQTASARSAGHEIFLHVPMAPQSSSEDPGPRALTPELSETELLDRLGWALSRFSGFVGINNHMGSRFTSDETAMTILLRELQSRGLAFLDSRTAETSVGGRVARRINMPFAARDVFLDHELDATQIKKQLVRLEEIARRHGSAIAIGHPHKLTLDALEAWLPSLAERGFVLVPVSAIIKRRVSG